MARQRTYVLLAAPFAVLLILVLTSSAAAQGRVDLYTGGKPNAVALASWGGGKAERTDKEQFKTKDGPKDVIEVETRGFHEGGYLQIREPIALAPYAEAAGTSYLELRVKITRPEAAAPAAALGGPGQAAGQPGTMGAMGPGMMGPGMMGSMGGGTMGPGMMGPGMMGPGGQGMMGPGMMGPGMMGSMGPGMMGPYYGMQGQQGAAGQAQGGEGGQEEGQEGQGAAGPAQGGMMYSPYGMGGPMMGPYGMQGQQGQAGEGQGPMMPGPYGMGGPMMGSYGMQGQQGAAGQGQGPMMPGPYGMGGPMMGYYGMQGQQGQAGEGQGPMMPGPYGMGGPMMMGPMGGPMGTPGMAGAAVPLGQAQAQAKEKPIEQLRILFVTDQGNNIDSGPVELPDYLLMNPALDDGDGWARVAVPLETFHGLAARSGENLEGIALFGDAKDTFWVSAVRLLQQDQALVADAGEDRVVQNDEDVTFTGAPQPAGVEAKYSWDFDDQVEGIGEDATGEKVTTTFAVPGEYWVTLTVTGRLGDKVPQVDRLRVIVEGEEEEG